MTFIEDIISAAGGAAESGSRWLDENTALGSHRRNAERLEEIARIAAEQGYPSAMHPEFRRQNPELAEEHNSILGALTQIGAVAPVTGAAGPIGAAARAARAVPNVNATPGPPPPTYAGPNPRPAAPQPAAPVQPPGLLTTLGSLPGRTKVGIGAGALGTGILAGVGLGAAQGRPESPSYGQVADGYGPGTPRTEGAWKAEEGRKATADADARRARQARGDEADIGLTEAQAAYYQAQREQALRAMANQDMTESEKLETAHDYAMQQVEARAKADRDNTMIREAGENERTDRRIASDERQTVHRGNVDMRGQDQQAREAQDRMFAAVMQYNVERGKLGPEKASKLYEAYVTQRKLPSEILDKVSQAVSRMEQYRTTVNPGQAPPGFEAGGVMAGLSKMAGVKFDPKQYIAQTPDDNWLEIARRFGAEPSNTPMPTVDQVFGDMPDIPELTPEMRQRSDAMSASSTQLPRPDMGMPDDVQQRIMTGLR